MWLEDEQSYAYGIGSAGERRANYETFGAGKAFGNGAVWAF